MMFSRDFEMLRVFHSNIAKTDLDVAKVYLNVAMLHAFHMDVVYSDVVFLLRDLEYFIRHEINIVAGFSSSLMDG